MRASPFVDLFVSPAAVAWPCEPCSAAELEGLSLVDLAPAEAPGAWDGAVLAHRVTRSYSPLTAQARLFYPQTYAASPYLGALNTPWFLDYGHLIFWFYFLSTFVIIMWLATAYGAFTRNIEPRMPIRETRGFSRAQTGDLLTAILPMTWSITMLMHATTHSTNFDENVASTAFSVTVVAYQWGWNYYFPRDIVETLAQAPKLVGRGRIEHFTFDAPYEALLEEARSAYLAKLRAQGRFASRWGRGTTTNVLNFYLRPSTALLSRLPVLQEGLKAANAPSLLELNRALEAEGALRGLAAWEPSLQNIGPSNWLQSQRGLESSYLRHTALASQKAKAALHKGGAQLRSIDAWYLQRFNIADDWRWAVAFKARALALRTQSLARPVFDLPAQFFFKPSTQPVSLANLAPSAWLAMPQTPAHPWGVAAPLDQLNEEGLAKTGAPLALLGKRHQVNLNKWAQLLLYGGAELSTAVSYSSLLTGDDLGPSIATSATELSLLLGTSAAWAGAKRAEALTPSLQQSALGAVWTHPGDLASRYLLQSAGSTYGAAPLGAPSALSAERGALWPLSMGPNALEGDLSPSVNKIALLPSESPLLFAWGAWQSKSSTPRGSLGGGGRPPFFQSSALLLYALSTHIERRRKEHIRNTRPLPTVEDWHKSIDEQWAREQKLAAKRKALAAPDQPVDTAQQPGTPADPQSPVSLEAEAQPQPLDEAGPLLAPAKGEAAAAITSLETPAGAQKPSEGPSSPFLGEPDPSRPIRGGLGKSFDPAWVNSRRSSNGIRVALYSKPVLFDWTRQWSAQALTANSPLFKAAPSSMDKKSHGGGQDGSWQSSPEVRGLLWNPQNEPLAKNAPSAVAPNVTRAVNQLQRPMPPVALNGGTPASATSFQAAHTPDPLEELDAILTHGKWTPEVNTSRRGNHHARFRVLWGPFTNALLSPRSQGTFQQGALREGLYGPAFFQGAPLSRLLQNPLYVCNIALAKLADPAPEAVATSSVLHAFLTEDGETLFWLPAMGLEARAPWHSLLVAAAAVIEHKPCLSSDFCTASPLPVWPDLWRFLAPNQRPRLTSFRAHAAATPSYYLSKALVALSVRAELETRYTHPTGVHPLFTPGSHNPLFVELAAVFATHQPFHTAPRQVALSPRFAHSFWAEGFWPSWARVISRPWAASLSWYGASTARLRSGYLPVRADIGSIRRLRVTKGICLPSDLPIHLICGSKDVIHSWAIPGLGVKIDCIPGYNSHRRVLLRWRGVYWGQCMEVCGRYHHWMPILVRVSHRDIFLSWCVAYLKLLTQASLADRPALASGVAAAWGSQASLTPLWAALLTFDVFVCFANLDTGRRFLTRALLGDWSAI